MVLLCDDRVVSDFIGLATSHGLQVGFRFFGEDFGQCVSLHRQVLYAIGEASRV